MIRRMAHMPRKFFQSMRQTSNIAPAGLNICMRHHPRAHASRVVLEGDVVDPPILPPSVTEISSTSNPYVKHCVKLRSSSRYRQDSGRCLLVGKGLLEEAIGDLGLLDVRTLFIPSSSHSAQGLDRDLYVKSQDAASTDILTPGLMNASSIVEVSEAVMKKLTGLDSVDGIDLVAELDLPKTVNFAQSGLSLQRLLVLDSVQDPGNLGTLLRTALAFGWDGVFLLPGCADPFGDKAIRSSRGAALRVPIGRGDLVELLQVVKAKGLIMLAADPEKDPEKERTERRSADQARQGSSSTGDMFLSGFPPVCLVLGSEGQGISHEVLVACTPIAIPMGCELDGDSATRMESLNVGVAGGILMFMLSSGLPQLMKRLQALVGRG